MSEDATLPATLHSLNGLYRLAERLEAEPVTAVQELLDRGLVEKVHGDFAGLRTVNYRLGSRDVARALVEEPVVIRPGPILRPSSLAASLV